MQLSIVVAASLNHVIGINNKLPWHLPGDLLYFKKLTTGHPIIMGRSTFDAIGKPLPNRTNIVLTRNKSFEHLGLLIFHTIEDMLLFIQKENYHQAFVIGGDTIYKQLLPFCNKVYLTRVHTIIENGDAFFPLLSEQIWQKVSVESNKKDQKNAFDFDLEVYSRIDTNL